MQVRVLFFGVLKDLAGRAEDTLQVPSGSTLEDVFQLYSERIEALRGKRPSILFARNQEFATPETLLADNDEVAFLPPVSGGSTTESNILQHGAFAIVRSVIDSQAFAKRLQRPEDGAVVIFEGIVRNHTKGRRTAYLDYEAYEPLALAQMRQLGLEIAEEFDLGHIGIIHRLGRLEVGEASVAIVTTSPHRRAAFQAAEKTIDRLKREVPIWKKEHFEDGAVWIEGEWDNSLLSKSFSNALP